MGGECFCFGLAKDIGVFVVFFWNSGEVDFLGDGGGFGLYLEQNWRVNVFEPERRDTRSRAGALIIAM